MKLSLLSLLSLACAAMSAPTTSSSSSSPQACATAQADFNKVVADMDKFTGDLTSYNPYQPMPAPGNTNDEPQLESDLKALATTCSKEAPLSSAQTTAYLSAVSCAFETSLRRMLDAWVDDRAKFQQAGLYTTAGTDLKNLKSEFDSWWACVVKRCSADKRSACQKQGQAIDGDFSSAIQAYS